MEKNQINTIYIPVDGTRRYAFNMPIVKKYTEIHYYDIVKIAFLDMLKTLFQYNFTNVIILLHDQSSFNRGEKYLKESIDKGVKPFLEDINYVQYFLEYGINIYFKGFNELYPKYGILDAISLFQEIEQKTFSENNKNNLIFYTGLSNSFDIELLIKKVNDISIEPIRNNMISLLYGLSNIDIDIGLYYGYPRNKIKPILLTDNTLDFYTKSPSFYLTDNLLRKVIFLTIQAKNNSISDKYISYDEINLEFSETIWGEKSYVSDVV